VRVLIFDVIVKCSIVVFIHICRNFDQLIPDAPELILNYLEGEQDASCKRNAFMMLTHVDRVSVLVCTSWRFTCVLLLLGTSP